MELFRGCDWAESESKTGDLTQQHSIMSVKWQICRFLLLSSFPLLLRPDFAGSRASHKLISIFPLRTNYSSIVDGVMNERKNFHFRCIASRLLLNINLHSSVFTTTASPSTFFNLNSLLEEDFENICIIKSRSIRARASRHAVANVLRDKNETFWYRNKIDGHFGKVEAKKRLQRSLLARNC